jgi:HEPN domain-containing protein
VAEPEASARWYRHAIGDLATAKAILADLHLPSREAAYLAQQAAEKALKSTIALDGTEPPWTHDLLFLRSQAPAAVRTASAHIDLRPLWSAASAARYPDGDDPAFDPGEIAQLVADATVIVDIVRRFLDDAGLDASGMSLA